MKLSSLEEVFKNLVIATDLDGVAADIVAVMKSLSVHQTRLLARAFFSRLFESDLMPDGLPQVQLVIWGMLLAATPTTAYATLMPKKYAKAQFSVPLAPEFDADRLILITLSMIAIGVVGLLIWDGVFPDRRDVRILGVLPIPTRHFVLARLASLGRVFVLFATPLCTLQSIIFGMTVTGFGAPISRIHGISAHFVTVALACALRVLRADRRAVPAAAAVRPPRRAGRRRSPSRCCSRSAWCSCCSSCPISAACLRLGGRQPRRSLAIVGAAADVVLRPLRAARGTRRRRHTRARAAGGRIHAARRSRWRWVCTRASYGLPVAARARGRGAAQRPGRLFRRSPARAAARQVNRPLDRRGARSSPSERWSEAAPTA